MEVVALFLMQEQQQVLWSTAMEAMVPTAMIPMVDPELYGNVAVEEADVALADGYYTLPTKPGNYQNMFWLLSINLGNAQIA